MVFYYIPRKRTVKPALSHHGLTITDLPDEMLLEILKHADTDTITKFRLTCSNFTAAGNSALQTRLKTLYIHSTIPSLRRAVEICGHPLLGMEIEEVALLGKSLQDHHEWSRSGYATDDEVFSILSMVWPMEFPSPKHGLPTLSDNTQAPDFASAYAPLLRALNSLPKLRKLSFVREARRPGFNQTSKDKIQRHARPDWARARWAQARQPDTLRYDVPARISDRNFFFELHSNLWRTLPEIDAAICLPDMLLPRVPSILRRPMVNANWTAIRTMTIGLPPDWTNQLWSASWRTILANSAALEVLSIYAPLSTSWRRQTNLEMLLGKGFILLGDELVLPQLHTLKLTCQVDCDERRPSCQGFDLLRFLQRHSESLKHLAIDNMLFVSQDTPFTIAYTEQMLDYLSALDLRHVKLAFNRLECGNSCPRRSAFPTTICECETYDDFGSTSTGFDRLATERFTTLDDETKAWDFGSYVMRQRQQVAGNGR